MAEDVVFAVRAEDIRHPGKEGSETKESV
jgi:hypothetical protein